MGEVMDGWCELRVPLALFWPASTGTGTVERLGPWQKNSWANPFYEYGGPVQVKEADGTVRRIPQPGCAKGLFGRVVMWRSCE